MKKWNIWALVAVLAVSLTSCEEASDGEEPTVNNAPANFTPTVPNADGVMVVINNAVTQQVPIIGTTVIFSGLAVAAFPNGSDFYAAGTVEVNGTALTKQSNNSYVYVPSATNINGIDFSNGVDWNVTGSSNVPAFTYNAGGNVPEVGGISVDNTLDIDANVNIAIDNNSNYNDLSNADSLYFAIIGPSGNIAFRTVGNSFANYNQTFSANQMADLGKGTGYVQIAAYDIEVDAVGNKQYAFIKQGIVTKQVTLD